MLTVNFPARPSKTCIIRQVVLSGWLKLKPSRGLRCLKRSPLPLASLFRLGIPFLGVCHLASSADPLLSNQSLIRACPTRQNETRSEVSLATFSRIRPRTPDPFRLISKVHEVNPKPRMASFQEADEAEKSAESLKPLQQDGGNSEGISSVTPSFRAAWGKSRHCKRWRRHRHKHGRGRHSRMHLRPVAALFGALASGSGGAGTYS